MPRHQPLVYGRSMRCSSFTERALLNEDFFGKQTREPMGLQNQQS
jgi:hypothetical protein